MRDLLGKILNERLSIGIIRPVQSIKNRVPIKLIVIAVEAELVIVRFGYREVSIQKFEI